VVPTQYNPNSVVVTLKVASAGCSAYCVNFVLNYTIPFNTALYCVVIWLPSPYLKPVHLRAQELRLDKHDASRTTIPKV
jgi:hypothetical protein